MESEASSIDRFLHTVPIVQITHIIVVTIAVPPVLLFSTHISKIALHDNCRFLLHAWAAAFLVCLIMHCAFILCDLVTGKYIPENNHDPPMRLLIFALHGFAHVMTSAQEFMLAIERAASCASPEQYHNSGLAKRVLIAAESVSVLIALLFLWQISQDNILVACFICNSIDLASLICLCLTTRYVAQKRKSILCSTLNEKYQIKEAMDVTRVMLPCGVISLIMKVSASLAPWIYSLNLLESQYMFTLTGGAYFIIESLNCGICCSLILRNHEGLRRITDRLMCWKTDLAVCQSPSTEDVSQLYFDALKSEWG